MDILLEFADTFIADNAYAHLFPIAYQNETDINVSMNVMGSSLARDNPYRQFVTIFIITWLYGIIVYFSFATLFYHLMFDKRCMNHPKFLKNQIWLEIKAANKSIPIIVILITPFLLLMLRGYSKLYDTTADGSGWWYNILQIPLCLLFNDFCLYWIHRFSHHSRVYKSPLYMHKLHHKFVIPTPYASFAIHPIEGFSMTLPYVIFPFIFPFQKMVHSGLYVFANIWSVGIHDREFLSNNSVISGAACHSLHHMHRNCNYGQYFTIFDRLYGTYREPKIECLKRNDGYLPKFEDNKDLEQSKTIETRVKSMNLPKM